MPANTLSFPPGFQWGSATAAHQVEGRNVDSDWWEWEQAGGKIKNGDSSFVACDWWGGRYRADFERARALGQDAFRLSVEWSRLEPREGEWNGEALRIYRDMLQSLHELGLTPLVTLHHFTNPRWFAAGGGWESPAAAAQFARYAARVVRELGDLCQWWVTINEPNVYAALAYGVGAWPPQKRGLRPALRVMVQMLRGHAAAYRAAKEVQPESRIGVAHHWRYFDPHRPASALDRLAVRLRDQVFNCSTLSALDSGTLPLPGLGRVKIVGARGAHDFIGLNYFVGEATTLDLRRPGELFGRAVLDHQARQLELVFSPIGATRPDGLELALRRLAKYGKPIYVTENGILETGPDNQAIYLVSHLAAVHSVLQAGIPVQGYFWWSLLDNFEWSEGYGPRFGLYHLDRESQQRTARPVADVYARIIRQNGIDPELLGKYGAGRKQG